MAEQISKQYMQTPGDNVVEMLQTSVQQINNGSLSYNGWDTSNGNQVCNISTTRFAQPLLQHFIFNVFVYLVTVVFDGINIKY